MSALAISAALSCGGTTESKPVLPKAAQLLVSPLSADVLQGEGVQIIVKVADQNGLLMTDVPIGVVSMDTSIINIDPMLVARANRRSGNVGVVVTAGGLSKTIAFAVIQRFAGVAFDGLSDTLPQLDSVQVRARPIDPIGALVPGVALTFVVNDPRIAAISSTGMLRSVGPIGDFSVSAFGEKDGQTAGGGKAVHVNAVPGTLTLGASAVTVGVGTSNVITVAVTDRAGIPMMPAPVTFESGDSSIARVSKSGVVYAVGSQGQTSVRVRAGTLQKVVAVTVGPFVRSEWNLVAAIPAPQAWSVVASPNGTLFASNTGGPVTTGSWRTLSSIGSLSAAPPSKVLAIDSKGDSLYVVGNSIEGVAVLDARSGALRSTLNAGYTTDGLIISPFDTTLYLTSNGVAHAIDVATHAEKWQVPFDISLAEELSVNAVLKRLYLSNRLGYTTDIDLTTHLAKQLTTGAGAARALPSLDGLRIFALGVRDGSLQVLNAATYGLMSRTTLRCSPFDMAHSLDGSLTFVSCIAPNSLIVLDQNGTHIRKVIALAGQPKRMVLSPDGKTLLVANYDGWVDVFR